LKQEDIEKVRVALTKAKPLIEKLQQTRQSKLIVFFCHAFIGHPVAYKLNRILRRSGPIDKLDVMIESGGGDIDATLKILLMLKAYSKRISAIVPFYAKSAATLLAIASDEIVMCKAGELGPMDPQVRDPASRMFVPAHSIQEAIKFIEETKDPLVKLSLADKIPPLLMGAFRDVQESTKQYLNDVCDGLGDKKSAAIHLFSQRFLSHGYPIDRKLCKECGFNVVYPEDDLENQLYDLHEIYEDLLTGVMKEEENPSDSMLIQSDSLHSVVIGSEDLTSSIRMEPALNHITKPSGEHTNHPTKISGSSGQPKS
jgi:serine dehydrogenase proteinase